MTSRGVGSSESLFHCCQGDGKDVALPFTIEGGTVRLVWVDGVFSPAFCGFGEFARVLRSFDVVGRGELAVKPYGAT